MLDVVVFDLETQRTFDEVGGRQNIHRMGLAAAVTYSAADSTYRHYTEETAADLIAQLRAASLIVGFNLYGFDYKVLAVYTSESLARLPTLNILHSIYRKLGFRLSLDSLASATLGVAKSADGLQAVHWFREGRLDSVLEYCQQDVELTYRLYQFGKQNKYVQFRDQKGGLRKVEVGW